MRAITDANGNLLETYQYDEFGNPSQPPSSNSQPFQYTGQQRDGESGLYYLRARMYDPSIGRFLSRDPLGGSIGQPQGLNPYAYAGNNPMTMMDPSGLSRIGDPYEQTSLVEFWGASQGDQGSNLLGELLQSCYDPSSRQYCIGFTPGLGGLGAGIIKNLDPGGNDDLGAPRESDTRILFGQESVKSTFAHGPFAGKTIGEVAAGLREGTISPDELPVDYVVRDGQRVALNNRSLLALRRAGMEPTVLRDRTDQAMFETLLDQHLNGRKPSMYIRIRGGPPGTSNIQ